jgi:hypothetical protein
MITKVDLEATTDAAAGWLVARHVMFWRIMESLSLSALVENDH